MGFRARKSIRVMPGVRLNLSKTGVGMSFGVGPARYTMHSSGWQTVSTRTGIPGVYYQESVSAARESATRLSALGSAAEAVAGRPEGGEGVLRAIRFQGAEKSRRSATTTPTTAWPRTASLA
jgi:hypothetical protein